MLDWNYTAPSSPPRRFSSSGVSGAPGAPYQATNPAASLLWKSQYSEPHGNIWNSCATLQPSTSIWGSQIQAPPHAQPNLMQPAFTSPTLTAAKFGPAPQRQRRMSSIPSLSGSVSSVSSLWFEDPYLVSPPPSPETMAAAVGSSSPPPSAMLPVRSPTESSATPAQEEFAISATSGPLYFVQFKGDRLDVFTAPGTSVYQIGDAVMVDADRGRDLGTVVAANVSRHDAAALKQRQSQDRQTALHTSGCANNQNNTINTNACTATSSAASNGHTNTGSSASGHAHTHSDAVAGPTVYSPKQILGVASASEISDMTTKINDETAAVALCNKRAAERHLDIKIVDAEYQWDRRKLTFFYTAETRVDFRDLVRELFRVYKTRIWMCATTSRQ